MTGYRPPNTMKVMRAASEVTEPRPQGSGCLVDCAEAEAPLPRGRGSVRSTEATFNGADMAACRPPNWDESREPRGAGFRARRRLSSRLEFAKTVLNATFNGAIGFSGEPCLSFCTTREITGLIIVNPPPPVPPDSAGRRAMPVP